MVERWLTRSFVRSCPTNRTLDSKHKAWWSKKLMDLRRKSRRLYNEARRHGTEQLWNEYKDCLKTFKKETRKAKRMDFIRVIEQLSNIKDTARLRKFLSKQPKFRGNLQNSNGKWTESPDDTIDLLLETHFPGCEIRDTTDILVSMDHRGAEKDILDLVTMDSDKWAIDSIGPYKSPGLDGVYPCMLQESFDLLSESYMESMRASLRVGYIPKP
ncbi:uncharacterized protein LOC142224822 [Haematobia irritans]|uniref:uncharacterized protein LOC142224822 n=1 Tax=Haematobia irritans TaxID=7368 RepID=UPI003F4FB864